MISKDGLSPEDIKTKAIRYWPIPRNKTDVQAFLGLVNFYRRFLKDAATIAKPLTVLTGNTPFVWTETEQRSFDRLKTLMSEAPV